MFSGGPSSCRIPRAKQGQTDRADQRPPGAQRDREIHQPAGGETVLLALDPGFGQTVCVGMRDVPIGIGDGPLAGEPLHLRGVRRLERAQQRTLRFQQRSSRITPVHRSHRRAAPRGSRA